MSLPSFPSFIFPSLLSSPLPFVPPAAAVFLSFPFLSFTDGFCQVKKPHVSFSFAIVIVCYSESFKCLKANITFTTTNATFIWVKAGLAFTRVLWYHCGVAYLTWIRGWNTSYVTSCICAQKYTQTRILTHTLIQPASCLSISQSCSISAEPLMPNKAHKENPRLILSKKRIALNITSAFWYRLPNNGFCHSVKSTTPWQFVSERWRHGDCLWLVGGTVGRSGG